MWQRLHFSGDPAAVCRFSKLCLLTRVVALLLTVLLVCSDLRDERAQTQRAQSRQMLFGFLGRGDGSKRWPHSTDLQPTTDSSGVCTYIVQAAVVLQLSVFVDVSKEEAGQREGSVLVLVAVRVRHAGGAMQIDVTATPTDTGYVRVSGLTFDFWPGTN